MGRGMAGRAQPGHQDYVLALIDADVRFDWAVLGLWAVVFALALLEGGCA